MPTLEELATELDADDEIEYVNGSKTDASLTDIDFTVADSIFTKLVEFPYEFEINSSLKIISINGQKFDNIENNEIKFEEIKNYTMFYDGSAKTQEEKEAISVTNGWIDVTNNCTSQYGTGTETITKNENSINFIGNNNGSIPAIAINKNIGDMNFYKLYVKMTGKSNTTSYTGNSMNIYYLNIDPVKNKFSIYGDNDNRIDMKNFGTYYSGTSYNDKILSTYKPTNKDAYICVFMSLYSQNLTTYQYVADMQDCWVVNQDNYTKLANYAGVEGEFSDIKNILTKDILLKICNNKIATEYMIKQCTGDLMCELLSNDELIGYLTADVKNKMIENAHWKKFIEIYNKQALFSF